MRIVESVADELIDAVDGRDLALLHPLVQLYLRVFAVLDRILRHRGEQDLLGAEQRGQLLVRAVAERPQEHRRGDLARPVHADPKDVVGILLELEPCASGRHDRRVIARHARLVDGDAAVNARTADELADDDSLGAVDDETSVLGHQREIAHEHVFHGRLAGVGVDQPDFDLERKRVCGVSFLTFLDVVLGRALERKAEELQFHSSGIVAHGREVVQDLLYALGDELPVRILLQRDQIRNGQRLLDAGEAEPFGIAVLDLVYVLRHYRPSLCGFGIKRENCPYPTAFLFSRRREGDSFALCIFSQF